MFADESGFSLRPSVRRTWAPRGQTPRIKHNFNWKRLHAIGAIGCLPDGSDPRLHLQVQYKAADAETLVQFVESLHTEFDESVILIWDGLPAHRCTKVTQHIQQQRAWLTTYRLPAYAPELNPVEYLWAAIKTKHTANVGDSTIDQLSDRIERAYNRYSSESLTLQGFLKASGLYDRAIHNS